MDSEVFHNSPEFVIPDLRSGFDDPLSSMHFCLELWGAWNTLGSVFWGFIFVRACVPWDK